MTFNLLMAGIVATIGFLYGYLCGKKFKIEGQEKAQAKSFAKGFHLGYEEGYQDAAMLNVTQNMLRILIGYDAMPGKDRGEDNE